MTAKLGKGRERGTFYIWCPGFADQLYETPHCILRDPILYVVESEAGAM